MRKQKTYIRIFSLPEIISVFFKGGKTVEYIIVQAGGKGTRLGHLTQNKPKALLPVENLPMLFHLFRKYPDRRFIIIADYQKEVLREYLAAFADVKYQIVDAEGTGTCAGIRQALSLIPDRQPFMLIWSDLILPEEFRLPKEYEDREVPTEDSDKETPCADVSTKADVMKCPQNDYIGISAAFPCRWSYRDGGFEEEPSCENGVAGFLLFTDKRKLQDTPFSSFYGDVRYDWAKLYYSIVGNYDRFNLKDFRLDITEQGATLDISSNHWEDMETWPWR